MSDTPTPPSVSPAQDSTPQSAPAGAPPEGAPRRSRLRRILTSWPFLTVVGLAALYFLALLVGVPYGGRWFLEKKLSETLDAPCQVASLRINPFTFRTEAAGVVIPYPPQSGAGEFVSFKRLEIRPALWEMLTTFKPNLGSVRLEEPRISVGLMKDGVPSLSAYPFAKDSGEKTPEDADARTEPFGFTVTDIEVTDGQVSVWDKSHDFEQVIDNIYIHIPLVSSLAQNRDTPVAPEVRATIDGSPVTVNATSTVFADYVNSTVDLDLGRIPIEKFRAYIAPYTSLILQKAAISTILSLKAGYVGEDNHFDISLTGTLNLYDVNVLDPAGKKSVLALKSGRLEVERFLLRPQDIAIHDLTLNGLSAYVARNRDGALNWQGYFGSGKAPAKKAAPKAAPQKDGASAGTAKKAAPAKNPAAGLPSVVLSHFALTNGRVQWVDETVGFDHTFENLQASLSNFSTRGKDPATFQVALKDALVGAIKASGSYSLAANTAKLDAQVDGLAIPGLAPYLKSLPVTIEKGAFATHIKADLDLNAPMPVRTAEGKMGVKGLAVKDAAVAATLGDLEVTDIVFKGAPLSFAGSVTAKSLAAKDGKLWDAAVSEFTATGLDFDAEPLSFAAKSVTVTLPKGAFTLKPDRKNAAEASKELQDLSRQMKELEKKKAAGAKAAAAGEEKKAAKPNPAASPLAGVDKQLSVFKKFSIGKLAVKNGSFVFRDERVSPPTTGRVDRLNLSLDDISIAPGSQAKLLLSGLFDKAPFTVKGTINPLKAPLNAAMRLELDGLNMINLSPFLLQALAYPIQRGMFTADLDVSFKDDELNSTNHFVIENFDLGPKQNVAGAADLPLPLAVALLKGPSGTIDLTVNADGRLDDPSFSVAGLVLKILGNIMLKVVTSPFNLVAGIFSSDDAQSGPDLQLVRFEPGLSNLDDKARASVAAVAALMEKRPALNLDVTGMASAEDRRDYAEAYALTKMRELKYKDLPSGDREKLAPEDVSISRTKNPEEFADLLYKVYNDSDLNVPRNLFGTADKVSIDAMLDAFRKAIVPTDADLEKLADARAEAVYRAFLADRAALASRVKKSPALLVDGKTDEELVPGVRLDLAPAQ